MATTSMVEMYSVLSTRDAPAVRSNGSVRAPRRPTCQIHLSSSGVDTSTELVWATTTRTAFPDALTEWRTTQSMQQDESEATIERQRLLVSTNK